MKVTSRFWVWSLLILLLGFLVVPELADRWQQYQLDRRISREKQKIAELVQAGDRGYDDLVRLVPSLWFGNISLALDGILTQKKRDRVADLCAIYVACGQKRHRRNRTDFGAAWRSTRFHRFNQGSGVGLAEPRPHFI